VTLNWFWGVTPDMPVTDYVIQQVYVPRDYIPGVDVWGTVNDGVSRATSYTLTVSNDLDYRFRVAAVSSSGVGDFSQEVFVHPAVTPTAPRSVTATPGPRSAVVKWAPPTTGAPFKAYRVDYSTDRATWHEVPAPPSATSLRVTGLIANVR